MARTEDQPIVEVAMGPSGCISVRAGDILGRPMVAPERNEWPLDVSSLGAFRTVPRTGVIFVSTEAAARGFDPSDSSWANLGQGQPETGPIALAEDRISEVVVRVDDQEYAPIAGIRELRAAVADLYNHRYRRGRGSKYSAENVAISGGGRAALTRAAAAMGKINLGHFIPDYTAYEELLDIFRLFTPIPISLDPERGYAFSGEDLAREIQGRGLGAVLSSNPCNPTGKLVSGETLEQWVSTARDFECTLLIDEFYSHYVWSREPREPGPAVSVARYVDDVDRDPVVLFDGLTKNWRYPGWRTTWTVGPKSVIDSIASAGSFLDGGGARPLQRAAVALLDPGRADREAEAIQVHFGAKREYALRRARELGFRVDFEPEGTFYVWASTEPLAPELRDGMELFRRALDERVILVPGEFFDVNPGRRRRASRFRSRVRLSFGPEREILERGFDGLARALGTG